MLYNGDLFARPRRGASPRLRRTIAENALGLS